MSPRVAISALFALDGAVLGGWMAHLPDVQRQHGLTPGTLGLTLIASSVGALSAMSLTAALVQRFGSRRVCLVAAGCVLVTVPLLVRAPSPVALALMLLLMGATNGTLDVAMNTHSMAVQDRFDRPILSAVHGWFCIGGFVGGLGTSLAKAGGVSPANHLLAASIVLMAVLLALAPGLLKVDVAEEEGARFALPRGRLLKIGLLTLLAFFAEGVLWDWSAVYLRGELRTNGAFAALGFGIGAGSMAVGRLLGDRLVARLGPVSTLRLSSVLTSVGILLAVAMPYVPAALLGFALAGVGLANAVPILFRAAARVPGVHPGAGLAAVTSIGYAAFLGGPPLVGKVADLASLRVGFGLVGILALAIGLWAGSALSSE